MEQEVELEVLEQIQTSEHSVRQRDLATIIGKSLGMTNSILKRLTEKGLLKISKISNRNISYVVTPSGLRALAGRSYGYFKRTIKNVVLYKDEVEREVLLWFRNLSPENRLNPQIVLLGPSDLDFIVEHISSKYGIPFLSCRDLSSYTFSIESTFPATTSLLYIIGEEAEDVVVKGKMISLRALVGYAHKEFDNGYRGV